MDVVIYHNPHGGASRNTLAMIQNASIEPHVIACLLCPPSRRLIRQVIERSGLTIRGVLREKGPPYSELGLGDPALDDEALLDMMMAHPILINRPFVVSPHGVRFCRPSEVVLELPPPSRREFTKEDGERVLDAHGRRIVAA